MGFLHKTNKGKVVYKKTKQHADIRTLLRFLKAVDTKIPPVMSVDYDEDQFFLPLLIYFIYIKNYNWSLQMQSIIEHPLFYKKTKNYFKKLNIDTTKFQIWAFKMTSMLLVDIIKED